MSKSLTRPGILSQKRLIPVRDLKSEAYEKPPDTENYCKVAEQLRKFEVMMELEDMENDRNGMGLFRSGLSL